MIDRNFKRGDRVSARIHGERETGTVTRVNARDSFRPTVKVKWDNGKEYNCDIQGLKKEKKDG